jgi:peptidyl-prolyl cis-trans isomerase SDCCAG10
MSYIYNKEPLTHGKVLVKTTLGDLDIELWSKEAPLACRNFVQLCMEDYYNGTIFHRIVQDFITQGGDPTGTGEGGESIYGHTFKVRVHAVVERVRVYRCLY